MAQKAGWKLERCDGTAQARYRSPRGFTMLEVLIIVLIVGIMATVTIGITPGIVRVAKGEGGTMQVRSFLTRVREAAVTRRRNIEIRFVEPNQLVAEERDIPGVVLEEEEEAQQFFETITFEGGLEYLTFDDIPDTPDAFGMEEAITLGGPEPVMFTSEGSFTDINGDPANVTLAFGAKEQPLTANAITILGTTATVRSWRWNGDAWTTH